jgi:hypothetical protein
MSLGAILGGLAGLLFPGGGALAAGIGSGIGSLLIDKAEPKDAIKNALIAGIGGKLLGPAIQGSGIGQAVTGAMANAGLGTQAGIAALRSSTAAAAAPAAAAAGGVTAAAPAAAAVGSAAPAATGGGFLSSLNPNMVYAGLSALGAAEDLLKPENEAGIKQYFSRHTGMAYDTPEERDEAERRWRANMRETYGSDRFQEADYADWYSSGEGFAMGGYVRGPGTGRSDSIPAKIYQDGQPVEEAMLSDGEFVMTERAVRGAGNGDRNKGAAKMYEMMRQFEREMS